MPLELSVEQAVRKAVKPIFIGNQQLEKSNSKFAEDFISALDALGKSCPPPRTGDIYEDTRARVKYFIELTKAYRQIGRALKARIHPIITSRVGELYDDVAESEEKLEDARNSFVRHEIDTKDLDIF